MPVISLQQQYVTRTDINGVIDLFAQFKSDSTLDRKIHFEADKEIKDIELSFLGYLALCKMEMPDLSISFKLAGNEFKPFTKDDDLGGKLVHKLRHTGVHLYLLIGLVPYTYEVPNYKCTFNFSDQTEFPQKEGWLTLSGSFIPSLLISSQKKVLFDTLFKKKLSDLSPFPLQNGVPGEDWNAASATLASNYRHRLFSEAKSDDHIDCLVRLGTVAFYRSLHYAKILSFFTDPELQANPDFRRPGIRAGNLISESYPYYFSIKGIFSELAEKPLVHQFIFSTLLESDILPGAIKPDTVKQFSSVLISLWRFSEDLVHGLQELANNILIHSGSNGIITARIIKEELYSDNSVFFKEYLNALHQSDITDVTHFFDIRVFDTGTTGIMPKLLENSKKLLDRLPEGDARGSVYSDVQQLEDGSFKLRDLLDPAKISRLHQQSKRAIAHIGLLTFSNLITKNNGIFKVSSPDKQAKRDPVIVPAISSHPEEDVKYGTSFSIFLPVRTAEPYVTHLPHELHFPDDSSITEVKGIEQLFEFENIRDLHHPKTALAGKKLIFTCRLNELDIRNDKDEEKLWLHFAGMLNNYKDEYKPDNGNDYIIHADFEKVSMNESNLLRFLGQWELEYSKITLIISNIKNSDYQRLKEINEMLVNNSEKDLSFWNILSPTIIYSYITVDKARFYFTDILYGKSRSAFLQLNKTIRRNHFNSTKLPENGDTDTTEERRLSIPSPAFYNKNLLLPFDLVLDTPDPLHLFEANATVLLMNEIKSDMDGDNERPIDMVKQLPGFRVRNSHYRLGSKLHISDFYYAKRIFQNNFFASRFAFMVANQVLRNLKDDDIRKIRENGLSLVGYGLYSELMLSLLEKLLTKSALLQGARVNHELIRDDDPIDVIKKVKLFPNIIIVVPIASTFSTAVKIEKLLIDSSKKVTSDGYNVISPHYNLLHIADGSENNTLTSLEKDLGWTSKNVESKTIELSAFFENKPRSERYFISLPSQWEKMEDCRRCVPADANGKELPLMEKALFEMDRKEINPGFIFGFPVGREPEPEDGTEYKLAPEMIRLRQYAVHNSHFIYSLDSEKFLEDNKPAIRAWLTTVKEHEKFNAEFGDVTHALIVASCHQANAAFIDLVNERLFNTSAAVIHYDPSTDHIQNFELIYGNEIAAAEKIIFVDDTFKSGSTFSRIYEFIRHIRKGRACRNKGIDACVILINKSQAYTNSSVESKLVGVKKIFGFANLNIFSALSTSNPSALQQERDRYKKLVDDSMGDGLKTYFWKQIEKLHRSQEFENNHEKKADTQPLTPDPKSAERHLLMLEATHLVYDYFARMKGGIDQFAEFTVFLKSLKAITKSPREYSAENAIGILGLEPLSACILKSLTQLPFTQYEPLRRTVFEWVIKLLDKHLSDIGNEMNADDNQNQFDFTGYRGLKFMIRRATLMNSNYLLTRKMFEFIRELYEPKGLEFLMERTKKEEEKNEIKTFTVYFVAQIKELLSRNFSRANRLEELLASFDGTGSRGFMQLIRILKGENAIVIQKYYEAVESDGTWDELYIPRQKEISEEFKEKEQINVSTEPLSDYLAADKKMNPQRYRFLEEFFKVTKQTKEAENNITFLDYLWIKNIIVREHSLMNLLITERSRYIFEKLTLIFEKSSLQNITNVGVFLSIVDGKDNSFLAYDRNNKGSSEMDGNTWHKMRDKFLWNFQNGIDDSSSGFKQTYIELMKDPKEKKWINLYSTKEGEVVDVDFELFPKTINRLVLMRLISLPKQKLGMVGIYFSNEDSGITDMNVIRYMLLLKDCISKFVERHHLNNEFRDWLIAENTKRLAMLSGHGKEMLQQIAKNNEVVRQIAIDLENIQLIMILHENIKANNALEKRKEKFGQFYNIKGAKRVDYSYLKTLEDLASNTYKEMQIETRVEVDARLVDTAKDISFEFDQRILNLVCFELFLNAKKNRWHFPDHELPKTFIRNSLEITAKVDIKDGCRQMKLSITNTGPQINQVTLDALNSRSQNVKQNDIAAGTSLIKMLIWEIFDGEVHFDTMPVYPDILDGPYHFCVSLILKEMP